MRGGGSVGSEDEVRESWAGLEDVGALLDEARVERRRLWDGVGGTTGSLVAWDAEGTLTISAYWIANWANLTMYLCCLSWEKIVVIWL